MQVLRFADRIASRWKNGGGTTWEYAVHPAGAGLDDFFWRISRARVEKHGTFSIFPGIDRTLTVIEGDVIDLLLPDRRVRIDRGTPPYRFAGDLSIECRVPAGPITDFNVMTRRGRWTHAVERLTLAAPMRLETKGDVNFVLALDALATEDAAGAPLALASGDAIVVEGATSLALDPRGGGGAVLTVTLDHIDRPWV